MMKFTKLSLKEIKNLYPERYVHFANFGKITKVIDGDSLKAYLQILDREIEVRLAGIDAPEFQQKYGIEAKRKVEDLLYFDKSVIIVTLGKDRFERYLSDVWLYPDTFLQVELVREGLAIGTNHPIKEFRFLIKKHQDGAKEAQLNYWCQQHRVKPKTFRKSQKM